ncbi:MAG: class I SAM-dependent methyltransferase [Phycisphaeraceae bacterium]
MSKSQKPRKIKLTARGIDKYDLYLRSVQEPEAEIEFFERAFKDTFKRRAMVLREDFCAAAAVCCEWVRTHKERTAVGVDLDPVPLEWGKKYNVSKLKDSEKERVKFLQTDVRDILPDKADIIAAENFSFFIFKTRDELRAYFKAACDNLAKEGLLVTDMMGGPDCMKEKTQDVRKIKIEKGATPGIAPSKGVTTNGLPFHARGSFKYVWEQASFDPITHDGVYHIHFRFKDGSQIKKAFTYHWRLWTIPEIRELMLEAGFKRADVYWEGVDKHGEGDGIYKKQEKAPSEAVFIAYIVGVK